MDYLELREKFESVELEGRTRLFMAIVDRHFDDMVDGEYIEVIAVFDIATGREVSPMLIGDRLGEAIVAECEEILLGGEYV